MFCGLCMDECPTGCLKMGKKVTMAGWERNEIVRGPEEMAAKLFSEQEAAALEAKRLAAKKAAAAAAKKKADAKKEDAAGASGKKSG